MSEDLKTLRLAFLRDGAVTLTGPDKRKLFLVSAANCASQDEGVLIAYEGGGTMFAKNDRMLTPMQMAGSGFSLRIAPALTEIINAILTPDDLNPDVTRLLTAE